MLELLLLSPVVPRSVRFAVAKVDAALQHITEEAPDYNGSRARPAARATRARRGARSAGCTPSSPTSASTTSSTAACTRYLVDLQRQCYRIGEHVEAEFFAHRPLTAQEVMA